tara:strand:- start:218 stop:1516 length:1299 start_codon:yes stop_codon:yes gene_type:complete
MTESQIEYKEIKVTHLFASRKKVILNHFKSLKKKADKFGVYLDFEISEPYTFIDTREHVTGSTYQNTYSLLDVTITHSPLKLDGEWELVGIYFGETGSVQQLNLDIELPKSFINHTSNNCDHCNHKRYRKNYFLVYSAKTGEFKQVGSSCLKDFCGISPARAIRMFSLFTPVFMVVGLEEEGYYRASKETKQKFLNVAYDKKLVINIIAQKIELDGYVKATFEEIMDGYGWNGQPYYKWIRDNEGEATLDFLIKDLESGITETGDPCGSPLSATPILKWWDEKVVEVDSEGFPSNSFNSWVKDCKDLLSTKMILKKDLNKVCSMVNHYVTQIEKEEQNELKTQLFKGSKHFGDVGERLTQNLSIKKAYCGQGFYGTFFIFTLENEDGNCLVYKGSKDIGDTDDNITLTFTIKSHDIYNEINQTVITRPNLKK